MTLQVDRTLECEGLACPLPVVRTKKTMEELLAGQVLEVRATDKGSVADLQSWAKRTGHHYIGLKEEKGVYCHYIRKAHLSEAKDEARFPHTLTNEELARRLDAGDQLTVIDVREPAEYAFGHIVGSLSIPLGELEGRLAQLDPSESYVIVCRSGNRSDMASQLLKESGFTNVTNAVQGMSAWTGKTEQQV
ncbi:sulfurtransferase TusA family protein [Paenibacillus sp. NPDC058071]|uniref:sulfurtransferase TusA family protein n=1 Tax=Paenibacillus sp. NPDC058071 TaxID=3346326 RepID=UPI0036D80CD5